MFYWMNSTSSQIESEWWIEFDIKITTKYGNRVKVKRMRATKCILVLNLVNSHSFHNLECISFYSF